MVRGIYIILLVGLVPHVFGDKYGIVENDKIVNVIEWDGQKPWADPKKREVVPLKELPTIGIDATRADDKWTPSTKEKTDISFVESGEFTLEQLKAADDAIKAEEAAETP